MPDRMDQLIVIAVHQHFRVWQTADGGWMFSRGTITIFESHTPETASDWMGLINTLRGAGLEIDVDDA